MSIVALNCTNYIVYRVVHNLSSLITLSKEIYPGETKFLLSAYNKATNKFRGYIILYLNQNATEELRPVTDIFGNEITTYVSPE